jgi:hypothetical protein
MPTVSVTINSSVSFDTDSGEFTPSVVASAPASSVVNGVRVVWTQDFTVSGTLRVTGSLPVLFAANGDIDVSGTIDVSSSYDGTTYVLGAGASSNAADCANPPEAGVKCLQHGASGGGGGGFGTAGGQGDHGAASRDCGDGDSGKPPTAGGLMVAIPTAVRAGCAGASGEWTDDVGGADGDQGLGGPGGGAVHLTGRLSLTVSGTINAGGGAGGGASGNRASGGGGGSGGYIGIESRVVTLTDTAVLAANGGGGGGGSDGAEADPGENGKPSLDIAQGGADGGGDPGNDGAVQGTPPEAAGIDGDRGGGGGGGGVGYILFHLHASSNLDTDAVITPGGTEL